MEKIAGEYGIEIYPDNNFAVNSSDNLFSYDAVYTVETKYQLSTKIGIKLFKGDELIKSAIKY